MVVVEANASMRCSEEGCLQTKPVELILLMSGGYGFRPKGDAAGWQVSVQKNGAFQCYCPAHAKRIQEASVIPDANAPTVRRVQ